MIPKALLKVVVKAGTGKSNPKMFTIRNIDCSKIASHEDLENVQLQSDVVGDFDVGFVSGSSVISIRNAADICGPKY